MRSSFLTAHVWPTEVPFPKSQGNEEPLFVLVQIPNICRDSEGKQEVRRVLGLLFEQWSGHFLQPTETPTGPKVTERICGYSCDISISYADTTAWLGIAFGIQIGIDAVSLTEFAEWESVAALYLGQAILSGIQQSPTPFRSFALAWATLEASLKCTNLPLKEHAVTPRVNIRSRIIDNYAVAVAFPLTPFKKKLGVVGALGG